MINDKLINIDSIKDISDNVVDLEYKISYINGLNLIYQSECMNLT